MAFINGKHIPYIYQAVPTASTARIALGMFTAEGGETIFKKRDLGFKPEIVIWALYEENTDLAETDTTYAIRDDINGLRYNIIRGEQSEMLGETTLAKPVRILSDGFTARSSAETDATFGAKNTYFWIAIKSEE